RAAAGDAGEWPYFLLDALVVLSIPAAFCWVRARKPYSEKHQAWFYGHTVTISRDGADAIRDALNDDDVDALVDAATPGTFDPVRGWGELHLYSLPYAPATPPYLPL